MAKSWAQAFYKSKPWRNVRDEVRRRDQYTCHDCGGRAVEVHHVIELTPDNIHDPNIALNPTNLMSLCGDCHKKRTQKIADVRDGYTFDENGQVVKD
jgi:5-methylcytosine-specific restriction endonuclease McrA